MIRMTCDSGRRCEKFLRDFNVELRSEARQKEGSMKEKKVIDYTRTYRRIEADKKKCILYIVILLLLGFLLMWTQIDDLTRWILFYKRTPKENKCQSL